VTSRNVSESERVTWQYGIYRPLVNIYGVGLNKFECGGRVTALPVYEDEGQRLVHVGFGTLNVQLPQNKLKVRARPFLRNAPGYAVPMLVNTGAVAGSRQYTIKPKVAPVYGPLTIQAEWTGQALTDAVTSAGNPQGTVFYHGGYVEALYFLTDEYQSYDKDEGVFGRVIPRNNFTLSRKLPDGCTDAWQIGLRLSYLDLNDKSVQGGTIYDWTVGLNWF
jgi:phosphate-selective porin OprO/OprP